MRHLSGSIRGRALSVFLVAAFMCEILAPFVPNVAYAAGIGERAVYKDKVPLDDVDEIKFIGDVKSNVLFMVEATAAMGFDPKGVMPSVALFFEGTKDSAGNNYTQSECETGDWRITYDKFGLKFDDVQKMMELSTYGIGMMPPAWTGNNLGRGRNLYGRDVDSSNNFVIPAGNPSVEDIIEANRDNYYFPFYNKNGSPVTTLKSAYAKQSRGLEIRYDGPIAAGAGPSKRGGNPSASVLYYDSNTGKINGTSVTAYANQYNYLNSSSYPYALVFKNPANWASLPSGKITKDDLVPNDSRMYQTKLVLWRLLEDESIWKNIRLGLSTTFLSPINTTFVEGSKEVYRHYDNGASSGGSSSDPDRLDMTGLYKVFPYGNNLWTYTEFFRSEAELKSLGLSAAQAKSLAGRYAKQGTSTSYQSEEYKNLRAAVSGSSSKKDAFMNSLITKKNYSQGISGPTLTGHQRGYTGTHGQFYTMWGVPLIQAIYDTQNSRGDWAIISSLGHTTRPRDLYKTTNRASLHVPIREYGAQWTKGGNKISQADKIRLWINGFADLKHDATDKFHYYNDPEIGISGVYALPQAIFPDPRSTFNNFPLGLSRLDYYNNGWINYSQKGIDVSGEWDIVGGDRTFEEPEFRPRHRFVAGSGEASGSAIDFFSPSPLLAANTTEVNKLAEVSFPVWAECEDNWLVVIASGTEPKLESDSDYSYKGWQAVQNLYNYTGPDSSKTPLQILKRDSDGNVMYDANKKYQIEKIYPNNPIRTMVIGIAKDYTKLEAGSALRKDAKAMRINLTKMAIAGVGGNVNVIPAGADKNPDLISDNDLNAIIASQGKINLFFAEDTQDLLKAVKSALSYITTHQMQPSKWSLVQGPSLSDEESFSVFASNFRIRTDTQWEGYLSRFAMTEQGRDDLASEKVWDLDEKVLNERGHRNLRYWQSYGGSHILANPNAGTFESLLALTDDKMELNTAFNGSTAAYLLDWFQGYDRYQYGTKKKLNSMLADIGQYGMNIVSVPVPYDALPGYAEWAREKAAVAISDDVKIYVQTNDGLLHVVNPDSGAEEKAILPPPMLIPSRLATLKTEVVGDRMRWIEVAYDGEDEPKKESPSVRSNAAYLLDGPLVKNSLPTASDGSAWGSYLLGGMGRGGSGYYMMNVDDRTEPSLLWYREWIEDKLYALDKSDPYNVPQIVTTYPDEYGTSPGKFFGEMGFNPPKPIMGSTGEPGNMRNILVLTGGTQKGDIDLSKNGTYREGAVMMILDPLTGKVLRGFTGDSNIETPAAGNSGASGSAPLMGMMVSEPSFFLSKTDARYGPFLAGAVFAADNRGTVFTVPLEGKEDDGTIKPLNPNDWYARAVGSLQMSSEMGTSSKSYSMPYGVFPVQINNKLWVCGGTADVLTMKGSDGTGGHIVNENQYIFSFSPEYDIYEKADISRLQSEIVTRDEMKVLNMSGGDLLSAGDNYKGWIYRLRGENDDPNITKNRKEYVSTKPLVLGNVLLVATFVETDMVLGKSETYNKSLCRPEYRTNGQARLYALDIATGGATKWWGGDKFIELDGAKITGINVADDWLMVAFDKTNNDTEVPDTIGDGEMEMNRDDVMQNVYFTHLPGKGAKINLELGENVMLYWNRK